jgi:cyclophilin family peptidyl-prolyl cis-trans isomerase
MIQGGDFTHGNVIGGTSIYGGMFDDEMSSGSISHDRPFLVSMANAGKNTNRSQFFITLAPCTWLDRKHVVFGFVTSGTEAILEVEKVGSRNGHPRLAVRIEGCGEIVSPQSSHLPVSSPPRHRLNEKHKFLPENVALSEDYDKKID